MTSILHLHGPLNLKRSKLPHFRGKGSGWYIYMSSDSVVSGLGALGTALENLPLKVSSILADTCLNYESLAVRDDAH